MTSDKYLHVLLSCNLDYTIEIQVDEYIHRDQFKKEVYLGKVHIRK